MPNSGSNNKELPDVYEKTEELMKYLKRNKKSYLAGRLDATAEDE